MHSLLTCSLAGIVYMYGGISTGLLIILKASLRWAPMVGPAMQIFQFSFISKTRPIQQSGALLAPFAPRNRS